MFNFNALQYVSFQAVNKARLFSTNRFLQLVLKIHSYMVGLIALSLVSSIFVVCHAVKEGEVLFRYDDQDPEKRTVFVDFLDRDGNTQSMTLKRYGFYEPRFTLPKYSRMSTNQFGPGITIWVNANALPEDDIHLKVRILETNLDEMMATSELSQKNFSRVSNQENIIERYGFAEGLIVDTHFATSLGPNTVMGNKRGVAVPINTDDIFRVSFDVNSRRGLGSPSMVLLRSEIFTTILPSATPRFSPLIVTRQPVYAYSHVANRNQSLNRPIEAHHQIDVLESPDGSKRTIVAYDPLDHNSIVNVSEISVSDLDLSDTIRTTVFHESSHVFTMAEGAFPPLILDKRITPYKNMVEEMATVGAIQDGNKGDFSEHAYKSEQNALRGKLTTPRLKYRRQFISEAILKWRTFDPTGFNQWETSGGRITNGYFSQCNNGGRN